MKKILFITHDTSRSGAPMVLLHFIRWIKQNHKNIEITVVALNGGDLLNSFVKEADHFYNKSKIRANDLKDFTIQSSVRFFKRKKKNPVSEEVFLDLLTSKKIDIIYANTIVSIPLAAKLKSKNKSTQLLVHVHELKTIIDLILPEIKSYEPKIDYVIAASNLVKNNLVNHFSFPEEKIQTIYEFSSVKNVKSSKKDRINRIKVAGIGQVHWRKGTDIFIQVAKQVKKIAPNKDIIFEWVGKIGRDDKIIYSNEILNAELGETVFLTEEIEEPFEKYNEFDLLLLPSREDPFPLVCIEMGMLGKPIICFEKVTGITEVLKKGGGEIIPYLDIQMMAEKVVEYYDDNNKLIYDSKKSLELFSGFTPDKICPQLFKALKNIEKVYDCFCNRP